MGGGKEITGRRVLLLVHQRQKFPFRKSNTKCNSLLTTASTAYCFSEGKKKIISDFEVLQCHQEHFFPKYLKSSKK